jgi:uncharacterized protein (DUF58 family)
MRGIHQLGPLRARVTDPFGLAEFERELAGTSKVVVVPRTVPLGGLPGGSGVGSGEDGSILLRSGQGEDDAVVRQYRQGDDLRRVHWKSTARRDELMVRVEERPWRGGTTVLLDRRLGAHRGHGPGSSLEWAVSFCASVCLHLHHAGQQVRLVTEDGGVLTGDTMEAAHSDHAVLDALAAVTPAHRTDIAWGIDPGAGHELLGIFGALTPASAAALGTLRPRRTRSLAVLLEVTRWGAEAAEGGEVPATEQEESARVLRDAGWRVVVARPRDQMTDVWAEICRVGSVTHR